jgi:hypothetical protein
VYIDEDEEFLRLLQQRMTVGTGIGQSYGKNIFYLK